MLLCVNMKKKVYIFIERPRGKIASHSKSSESIPCGLLKPPPPSGLSACFLCISNCRFKLNSSDFVAI